MVFRECPYLGMLNHDESFRGGGGHRTARTKKHSNTRHTSSNCRSVGACDHKWAHLRGNAKNCSEIEKLNTPWCSHHVYNENPMDWLQLPALNTSWHEAAHS